MGVIEKKHLNSRFWRYSLSDGMGRMIPILYGIGMTLVLIICFFFHGISFGGKSLTDVFWPPLILVACGAVLVLCLTGITCRIPADCFGKRSAVCLAVGLLILQVASVHSYYFATGWDVAVLENCSDAIVRGEDVSGYFSGYFSQYPNNLFLLQIFVAVKSILHVLHLDGLGYFAMILVQCALNTLTGLLLIHMLQDVFQDAKCTVLGFMFYFFLAGMSPWLSIPYSDSMALLFPLLLIWLYRNRGKFRLPGAAWFCIGLAAWIGYKLKPQVLIVLIAILITEGLGILGGRKNGKTIARFAGLMAGLLCGIAIVGAVVSMCPLELDPEMKAGMPHYLMMGLNTETYGIFLESDVEFSWSFQTVAERNAADLQAALSRIREMGFTGVLSLMARKTLSNYYNGTFSWLGEGGFLKELAERSSIFGAFFRRLFYGGTEIGVYYPIWCNFVQMLWLTVLGMNGLSVFSPKNETRDTLMLSIIGVSLFELIFEARSRYLFSYVPLYIILAVYGYRVAANLITKYMAKV